MSRCSAWSYKGNNGDDVVATESLNLKCVIPDAGDATFQIHCFERSAYAYVLRAFCAQPNLLSWVYLAAIVIVCTRSVVKYQQANHKQ
jgi:hypothetical protein